MTMHLAHPALTTTGRKSGPKKWASAEQKRQHQQLEQEWKQRQERWQAEIDQRRVDRAMSAPAFEYKLSAPPGRETKYIPSRDSGLGVAALPQQKVYTGDKIKGIGTMHKSNAVPIFTDEEAQDIAHMRR